MIKERYAEGEGIIAWCHLASHRQQPAIINQPINADCNIPRTHDFLRIYRQSGAVEGDGCSWPVSSDISTRINCHWRGHPAFAGSDWPQD